jgi:hypothetical protein
VMRSFLSLAVAETSHRHWIAVVRPCSALNRERGKGLGLAAARPCVARRRIEREEEAGPTYRRKRNSATEEGLRKMWPNLRHRIKIQQWKEGRQIKGQTAHEN